MFSSNEMISLILQNIEKLGFNVKKEIKPRKMTLQEEDVNSDSVQKVKIKEIMVAINELEYNLEKGHKEKTEINFLINLYQQATEYFSAVNDPQFDTYLQRMLGLFKNDEYMKILREDAKEEIKIGEERINESGVEMVVSNSEQSIENVVNEDRLKRVEVDFDSLKKDPGGLIVDNYKSNDCEKLEEIGKIVYRVVELSEEILFPNKIVQISEESTSDQNITDRIESNPNNITVIFEENKHKNTENVNYLESDQISQEIIQEIIIKNLESAIDDLNIHQNHFEIISNPQEIIKREASDNRV